MEDILLTLAVPAVVIASGIYTLCACRRQRRNPPSPYTRQAARTAALDVTVGAETVVSGAYAALGRLYTDPAPAHPARNAPVVTGRRRDPSRPAPAPRP